MSSISKEDVLKLALLARLSLTEEEAQRYTKEFASILDYVEQLSSVDTEGLKPTYQVHGLITVGRPDEIVDYGTDQKGLLKNVPKVADNQIEVKRMIG